MPFKDFIIEWLMEKCDISDQYEPDKVTSGDIAQDILKQIELDSVVFSDDRLSAEVKGTYTLKIPLKKISISLVEDEGGNDHR